MQLTQRVITRDEDDGWLLYNGDNGGLIKVTHDAYKRFFVQGSDTGNDYEALYAWLLRHGFLSTRFATPPPPNPAVEPAAGFDGFFRLRSERSPMNVLWAVTPACNLRCIYCFPDAVSHAKRFENPPLDALLGVAEEIVNAKVLKVTLSGGECLLLPDVWEIADQLRRAGITVVMLSNGGPVTERVAQRAKALGLIFGISLDGPDEASNSPTRGPRAYNRSIRALQRLVKWDVPVSVIITVTTYNFEYIESLVVQVEDLGVKSVTFQDLRPFGTRDIYDRTRLTADQERKLSSLFTRLYAAHPRMNLQTSELFFCSTKKTNDRIMQCPAWRSFCIH